MSNPYINDDQSMLYQTHQANAEQPEQREPEDDFTAPYTPYQHGAGQQQQNTFSAYTPPAIPATPAPARRRRSGMRTFSIFLLALVLAVVFGTGLFAGWEFGHSSATVTPPAATSTLQPGNAPTSPVPTLTGTNADAVREAVIAKVRPTVVQVNVTLANGAAIGSGVIIDKRGYIVTNNHVVSGAQSITVVLYDGTRLPAQLTGTDPTDDLAVIKINPPRSNLAVATLGDSSKLVVGQEVLAIGNPLGNTQTVTNGIISALGRTVTEGQGGAIIPIAIGKVEHTGRAELGVQVADVDPTLAAQDNLAVDHGALIVNLVSGGPAAQAGLQAGDVIVQVGSKAVNDTASLGDALSSYNPGETVPVTVYRGNQQLTVNVKLGELPSQGG